MSSTEAKGQGHSTVKTQQLNAVRGADLRKKRNARRRKRTAKAETELTKKKVEGIDEGGKSLAKLQGYLSELRSVSGGSDLIVTFSTYGKFALYRHKFQQDVLFLADSKQLYYLRRPKKLAKSLIEMLAERDYQRAIFIGSSKGGFGAMAIAKICAAMAPHKSFNVLSFAPQVKLFPLNKNLVFRSYREMLDRAKNNKIIGENLREYGDVSDIGECSNIRSTTVFASGSQTDRAEAERVHGPNARLREVPGSFHGVLFYFLARKKSRKAMLSMVRRTYVNAKDPDVAQTEPADIEALVDKFMSLAAELPSLNELIRDELRRS